MSSTVPVRGARRKGQKFHRPTGVVLYKGPSLLNGEHIVVIATGLKRRSKNRKTGGVIQVYILVEKTGPLGAAWNGEDQAVCGNCPHRPLHWNTCYVNVGRSPQSVWKAYQQGTYPMFRPATHLQYFENRVIRLGAYGDPAAVPLSVWDTVCGVATRWMGYTHQWRSCDAGYAKYCMASCETVADRRLAMSLGYRTFRIRLPEFPLDKGEFVCPASHEAGKRLTCDSCKACHGNDRGNTHSPAIELHGMPWKVEKYRRITLPMVGVHVV